MFQARSLCRCGWTAVWVGGLFAVLASAACGSRSDGGPTDATSDHGAGDDGAKVDGVPDAARPDVTDTVPSDGLSDHASVPDSVPVPDSAPEVLLPPLPTGPAVAEDFVAICPLDSEPKPEHWDRMQGWGARIVRQGFFWEWITAADGSFDFSWPDRYFDEAEKRGIAVLVVLDYDSPTIHEPGDPRPSVPASGLDKWLEYVTAVATRYKDRAWGFEVWNEPNLPNFWKGSKEEFVELARVTVDKVHEVAPGVPVSVAGLSLLPVPWLDSLHAAGVVAAADAISFHPYWLDGDGALDMVREAKKWLKKKNLDKPIWITEYGWPSGGNYPTAATLEEQAERVVRFQSGAAALEVRPAWWDCSQDCKDPDSVEDPTASEGLFGLAYPTAGDKPAASAYSVMSQILPGAILDEQLASALQLESATRVLAFLRPDGTEALVLTNESKSDVELKCPASLTVAWSHPLDSGIAVDGLVTLGAGRSVVLVGSREAASKLR